MSVEVICPSCEKRYRVDEKYAGKSATCKACGGKMRVPVPEPEPVAADTDGFDFSGIDAIEQTGTVDHSYTAPIAMAPPPTAAPAPARRTAGKVPPGLQYAAPGRTGAAAVGGDTFVDQLRDRWVPIGMIVLFYAIPQLIDIVARFANGPFGAAMGNLVVQAITLAVLVKIVIPIAVYGLNIGARMTDFEPPGDVAYRLFASFCGVPAAIALMTLLVVGGTAAGVRPTSISQILMVIGVALAAGLAVSYFLLWFLLRIGPGQAAAAWVFAGMFYILGAIVGGIVIGLASCGVVGMFGGRH